MTMNVRNKRVVKKVKLNSGIGLELGPLASPVVKKSEGDIYYLDHLSQADLRKKYKNEPVDLDKIVPVDYVIVGSLKETVGRKKFDYVIASHVIEHIPDTISWLKEIHEVLNPGGILSLAIPDKRFTFDYDRHLSYSSDVIGAYVDNLTSPTSAMMYDYIIHCADGIDTAVAWGDKDYYKKFPPKRRWNHQDAVDMCLQNLNPDIYVDCHCYVYTPTSFAEILRELTENDLIDFEVASFLETQSNELEFYVSLRKVGRDVSKKSRLQKIPKIKDEQDIYREKNDSLMIRNEQLEREIRSIKNSISWNIISPLRRAKGVVRRKSK
ncbi:methyltransferase domain-containing protein [Candidatus Saccharibacteria bacterium]|nr:methyltransferase domain-containing protein [Candidatus Saccharibacteria bacterium]